MPAIRKLYHSIREVSEITGLKPHVLRYWESEFDELRPKKNRAGNRTYTDRDIEVLLRVQRLLRDEKYTIEGARTALARELSGDEAPAAPPIPEGAEDARARLADLRTFLAELLAQLEAQ